MESRSGMSTETRLALLEGNMDTLLGNGKTGVIAEIRGEIKEVRELLFKARYVFMGCFVAIMVMLILSGSGTVSLESLIKLISK